MGMYVYCEYCKATKMEWFVCDCGAEGEVV